MTYKTEETDGRYPKHNSVHYEQTVPLQSVPQQAFNATVPSYTVNTELEPEMSTSPARGSTGLSMPTTPVSPSNSEISGSNGSASGRKARIGKNSVREQQLLRSNVPVTQPGAVMDNMYAQELPPHLQHYHHEMMYNPNLYPHFDQRYGPPGQPTYLGHIHHLPQPPPQQQQQPPSSKEDDLYVSPMTSVKQEPIIKTERLEVKQELVSGDDEEAMSVVNSRSKAVENPRAERRAEKEDKCDSASVTKPKNNYEVAEARMNGSDKDLVDQCQRASDKTNNSERQEDSVCDMTSKNGKKGNSSSEVISKKLKIKARTAEVADQEEEDGDNEREASSSSPSSSSAIPVRSATSSILRLSGSAGEKAGSGPKKSNYKKLIKPAEPKPYLSCAISGALKRADKRRMKFSNCSSDRARLRMLKKHRRRKLAQQLTVAGKVVKRGGKVRGKMGTGKGKLLLKRSKKRELINALANESTSSEESSLPVDEGDDTSQDKNNNNMDKELNNNNVLTGTTAPNTEVDGQKNHLDETIDLVARGHFEVRLITCEDQEEIEVVEDLVPSAKRQKVDPLPSVEARRKSKSSKTKTVKAVAKKSSKPAKKSVKAETTVLEKPKSSKTKAKKSKAGKKESVVVPEKDKDEDGVSEVVSEETEKKTLVEPMEEVVVVANTSLPEPEKEDSFVAVAESIRKEKKRLQEEEELVVEKEVQRELPEEAPEDEESSNHSEDVVIPQVQVTSSVSSAVSVSEEVRSVKGRVGRKPKKGGLKLSSRKRKHHQRLSKALEEVPIKKHVGAPRWSNGWNWLGESFQGLIFLNVSILVIIIDV